jgi:hypothetical protein
MVMLGIRRRKKQTNKQPSSERDKIMTSSAGDGIWWESHSSFFISKSNLIKKRKSLGRTVIDLRPELIIEVAEENRQKLPNRR